MLPNNQAPNLLTKTNSYRIIQREPTKYPAQIEKLALKYLETVCHKNNPVLNKLNNEMVLKGRRKNSDYSYRESF